MLPHEKTEILGCKSVKLLYFIPMLPTVVQSMMFHLHADLPYCGLKRLNSESRCWFAQYPAPFPICCKSTVEFHPQQFTRNENK